MASPHQFRVQFREPPTVVDCPDALDLQKCRGSIEFFNVTFSYQPGKPAVKNFTLQVEPGMSVAIVGESGSGKSTLLRLLLRFYDVDHGYIRIDGTDIHDVTLKSLRRQFGVVPQDMVLFNDTVLYNILYAKADADRSEVEDACRSANIHEKIMSLPKKYETVIGERGLRLSGGERQRVMVVRPMLRDIY